MDPTQIPLRDLHLPETVGWWPMAPGWWLLLAMLLTAMAWGVRKAYRHWRRNAPRRMALRELARVRAGQAYGMDDVAVSKELSELLRRAMLAYAPRNEVAGLTGEAWLKWLDRGLEERPFTEGAGRLLETLPYQSSEQVPADCDVEQLTAVVRRRLKAPLVEGRS